MVKSIQEDAKRETTHVYSLSLLVSSNELVKQQDESRRDDGCMCNVQSIVISDLIASVVFQKSASVVQVSLVQRAVLCQ